MHAAERLNNEQIDGMKERMAVQKFTKKEPAPPHTRKQTNKQTNKHTNTFKHTHTHTHTHT